MKREDIWRGVVLGVFLMLIVVSLEVVLLMPAESAVLMPTGFAAGGQARYGCPVASGYVTACYLNPLYKSEYGWDHQGMDFGGCGGKAVRALTDGKAIYRINQGSLGNLVTIEYNDGWKSRYAHLHDFASKPLRNGEATVRAGEVVGHVGGSGGWPIHLHYELYNPSGRVDPWYYSCWDISYGNSNGAYCSAAQKAHHNPGGARDLPTIPGGDYSDVDVNYNPAAELAIINIVPLVAKLDPNTYGVNPSYKTEIDYSLKEYEALFEFAWETTECQNGHRLGVNHCLKELFTDWKHDDFSFTFKSGNCVEDFEMNPEGYGTYELCAVSEFILSYGAAGLPDNYPVSYAFAVVLEDNDGPPQVERLQASRTSDDGVQPEQYRVSWDAPAGCEDVESYQVTVDGNAHSVTGRSFTLELDTASPTFSPVNVRVTPYDYAGNQGRSDDIDVP